MASIDERVVEMKFRREDFIKGTEETLGALARLEEGLLGAGGIADGVRDLSSRFTTIGTIGTGALVAIGGAAVNAGMKLANNIIDPIFSGGKKRALNLEQANFQLMGILKNSDDVALVMKDVSYAVDGTAYGLDAAAIAAAQFAASGMRGGEDMANALRGISGVAAMAGSSYEDVSSVFTKVAGQGRLMGDDLNRLASRGINAAASMTEYFNRTGKTVNATEAEIREMVTKGEVSFADFADAMNQAFGEHATKANETYTGSLSNIKAALARIGAPAFTLEHEKMRRVFNALRPVVDAFQKSLGPVYTLYKEMVTVPIAEAFERWGAAMATFDFGPISKMLGQFLVIGNTFTRVVLSWIRPVTEAFGVLFADAPNGSWMETISDFLDGFNNDLGGLEATEEQANAVRGAFEKVFEAVKGFVDFVGDAFVAMGPVVEAVWDIFKEGIEYVQEGFELLRPYIEEAFEYLFGIGSPLRTFWDEFQADVEESGSVFITLGERIRSLYETYILPVLESLENFKDVLVSIKDEGLKGFGEKVKEAFQPMEGLWTWLLGAKDLLIESFEGMEGPLGGIKAKFPSVKDSIIALIKWISEGFTEASPLIDSMFDSLKDFFVGMGEIIGDFIADMTLEDLEKISEIITKVVAAIMLFRILDSVKGTFDSVTGFFGSLTTAVTDFNKRANLAAKGSAFLMIAGGFAILAAALWVMAQIPTDKLLTSAIVLAVLGAVMTGFMLAVSKVDGGTVAAAGFGLGLFAGALLGMAAVMVILGSIPYDVLVQGGIALGIMVAAVTVAAVLMGLFAKDMPATAFGLLLFAGALLLLVVPLQMLGSMDYAALEQGITALGGLLLMLLAGGALSALGGEDLLVGAIGLAAVAGALTLMVVPIQQLGAMDYAAMDQGLRGVATAVLILVGAALIMQGLGAGALGLIAISAAMVILAFGLGMLADVPFGPAAMGLVLVAGALAILVIASAASNAVLPGMLGLAALIVAFGLAALFTGAGALLFAFGIKVLGDALPATTESLIAFALMVPLLALAAPFMVALGLGLGIFGVGALIAGAGAMLLGLGLLMLGVGVTLIQANAPGGAAALIAFVDAIMPLIWEVPQLVILTATFLGLGGALIVLGTGLLLAGVGGIALGLGAISAGIGIAILIVLMALVTPLVDRIVTAFEKLGPIAPGIAAFGNAARMAGGGLAFFASAASDAATQSDIVGEALKKLGAVFDTIATAASNASTSIAIAMMGISTTITINAITIKAGTDKIETAFDDLIEGVTSTGPKISGASAAMILGMSSELSKGSSEVKASADSIISAFNTFALRISTSGTVASTNTKTMVTKITSELTSGSTTIDTHVTSIGKSFARLESLIRQNGSKASTEATKVVTGVKNALSNGVSSVYIAAFNTGMAVANGMVSGIGSGSWKVENAARRMASRALAAANAELGVKSPSREAYKMMSFFVDGAVNALHDGTPRAENASVFMAESMMAAVNKSVDDMSARFDELDLLNFSPTITPVLDLDQVGRQASGLNGMFNAGIDPSFNRGQANSLALLEEALSGLKAADAPGVTKKYEFHQVNNSPKALSASEIYRTTKNLISIADREET